MIDCTRWRNRSWQKLLIFHNFPSLVECLDFLTLNPTMFYSKSRVMFVESMRSRENGWLTVADTHGINDTLWFKIPWTVFRIKTFSRRTWPWGSGKTWKIILRVPLVLLLLMFLLLMMMVVFVTNPLLCFLTDLTKSSFLSAYWQVYGRQFHT